MQSASFGNLYFYDRQHEFLAAFADIYDNRALRTFGSDNLYELTLYAKELPPDIMIINLQQKYNPADVVDGFMSRIPQVDFPIIAVNPPKEDFAAHPKIARYLDLPLDFATLNDTIESFTHGQKMHQIMLLDAYSVQTDFLHEALERRHLDYFEVHNVDAAISYLQKNNPQIVLVEYSPEFIALRHMLKHPRVFYVDRHDKSAEIEKFLA